MRAAETTSDIRFLTDAELDGVSGGHPAIAIVPLIALATVVTIGFWDLPVGMSVDEARQIAVIAP